MSVRNTITAKTEKATSLERAVMRSNPKLNLMQAREHIGHVLTVSDFSKSFNLYHLSTDTIRKLTSLAAQSDLKMANLIGLLADHGEEAIRNQIEADKAAFMHRAKSGQSRQDENSGDPEERRLARALIAFTTQPGFHEDVRRTRLTKRGQQ
jgi:hypothetical protein